MSALILRNRFQGNTTLVENEFIDNYMAAANGEYVKVYLLLLRHLNNPCVSLSIAHMADCLENTEGDILRALKYWEKEGLLTLEYDRAGSVVGLEVGRVPKRSGPEAEAAFASPAYPGGPAAQAAADTLPSQTSQVLPVAPATPVSEPDIPLAPKRSASRSRKELKQILFIAEQYLGKTLTRTDVDTITYFYDSLGFSADLIEYLIEYCVENGHKSMHYIQKVALSWADEHITSVEQAKNTSALYNKTCYSILNAFGIKGRGPAVAELEFIRKWTDTDGTDLELILEACNRTISAIHQPSFEYTDRILQNWRSHNVRTLADVRILDSAYEQEKNAQKKSSAKKPASTKASQSGYIERSYDMDELEKQLLNSH